jgi:hypothetical protein
MSSAPPLLVKTHNPTAAMLGRICHLAEEQRFWHQRHARDFMFDWYLQYYLPDASQQVLPFQNWCNGTSIIYTLDQHNLTSLFGEKSGRTFHAQRWILGSVHEIAFHAMHGSQLHYDFMWVIEQDVAWQGNLFELFSTFATKREEDYCATVCTS